jgi:hypothetical protein
MLGANEAPSLFGGRGDIKAAGIEGLGYIGVLKKGFLLEAGRFLDGTIN